MEKNLKVGDDVLARYNRRCKWKPARIWEIDLTRSLPYGISELCTTNEHGQKGRYYSSFRVKEENIKAVNHVK